MTHTLGSAADGRVTVSGSLLMCLDLLTDLSLDLVCTAGYEIFSFLVQAGETFLKYGYLLHYCLENKLIHTSVNQNMMM